MNHQSIFILSVIRYLHLILLIVNSLCHGDLAVSASTNVTFTIIHALRDCKVKMLPLLI